MGFTVEDMLIYSSDKYRMKLIAGKNGWSNSVGWLLMLEERTIIRNFSGLELAVTTGLGFQKPEELMALLKDLTDKHASGLIINTGYYILDIPQEALEYCEENDFPLLTVPWEIFLADMIKDLSIRVFLQGSTDEQLSEAFIHAIEQPDARDLYVQSLLPHFDVDGTFQAVLFTVPGLDAMDTVERKRLAYRMHIYLTNITHNGHFFYYDSVFVLIINALTDDYVRGLVSQFCHNLERRMPGSHMTVGIGSQVRDIVHLSIAYKRARSALAMAEDSGKQVVFFDDMGIYRLLYSVSDTRLLQELCLEPLEPLLEYDRAHHADYVATLEQYLLHDGSIQAVSEVMYTHRNTVMYRMNNIRKLLDCPLETQEQRLPLLIACLILHMRAKGEAGKERETDFVFGIEGAEITKSSSETVS